MAEMMSVSNQGRELTCSLCQKTFPEMTISSCFHTFCLDCLKGQMASTGRSNYRCPICKVPVKFPGEVIRDFSSDNYGADDDVFVGVANQTCDICSDGRLAINRCVQCEENLCHACTNAHLKMKASRYHKQHVVPLVTESNANKLENTMSQRNCWRHRNEEIQFVCKKCDTLLCLICKLMEHEHHVTKPISEEANEVRKNLSSLLQKQVSLGETLQMRIQEADAIKTKYPLELEHQLTKLNVQTNQIHAEIDNEKQKVEKELKLHYGDIFAKYAAEKGSFQENYDSYRASNTEALQLINSNNDVYVVGKGKRVHDQLEDLDNTMRKTVKEERKPVKPSRQFHNGVIDSNQLQRMVGFVTEDREHSAPTFVDRHLTDDRAYRTLESRATSFNSYSVFMVPYKDGVGYIYGIAPVGPTKAWITLLDHSTVLFIDKDGTVLSSIEVGETCEDVAAILESYCYVSCPRTQTVKRVSQDGNVETILSGFSQDPHGIAMVTSMETGNNHKQNRLYVCFTPRRSSVASLPGESDNQTGCVRIFTENGEDVGKLMVSQTPVRVDAHVESRSLCISDHSHGCVTVTDISGQVVKAIYTGESEDEAFKPLGVCFDSSGNVIVAEWSKNRVSLVSQEGGYMRTLTDDMDGPQSVACKYGVLWVGGKKGVLQVYQQ